ncbi:hypothetical protein [Serpentinicella alkaliphila]|uniref:Uncharacterized protein n=1 Tax=Serpentinicella alkaliphila TaxID=1734049 RepID=A0A4R2T2L7_9FIRM|nr:hypothetical protein [Serpentinicella alkaliphila]QUH25860.1 hypothetical protein HZR23_09010 [Serpentinicella alkaliphila]TCP97177.1 hypothetical protein EDD79_10473 [Serpentinicella alkaliphila]
MRKKRYFQHLYKYDELSNTYLIEVSLDSYDDVYDDWDASPFKKRDIEDEFNDFVVNSSQDIPFNHDIKIVLYLPESKKDEQKEATLISAYKNYYAYALDRLDKRKSILYEKTIFYLLFSVFMLSIGYFFFRGTMTIFSNILHEGIFIGGWVFLWEFFTSIFITRRELHEEYKIFKRLYKANIIFIYINEL